MCARPMPNGPKVFNRVIRGVIHTGLPTLKVYLKVGVRRKAVPMVSRK